MSESEPRTCDVCDRAPDSPTLRESEGFEELDTVDGTLACLVCRDYYDRRGEWPEQ